MTKDAEKLLKYIVDESKKQHNVKVEVNVSALKDIPNIRYSKNKLLHELEAAGVICGYDENVLGEISVYLTTDGLEYFDNKDSDGKSSQIVYNVSGGQVNIAYDNGKIEANVDSYVSGKELIASINAAQNIMAQNTGTQFNIITYGQDITFTNNFVGRENEINEILEKLKESNRILISGMGGIGKTTILKKLYHTIVELYKNDNKKVGYFEYELSMDDTICNAIEFEKTGDRNIDFQKSKRILEDYANYCELIIFIDNVPTERYNELQQLNSIKGKIIITSRQNEYENYDTVFIDKMSVEECKEIFKKESGLYSDSHELEYIVNTLIGRHTLTVRLLAKIAKKKQWTMDQLKNKLLDLRFNIQYKDSGETTNILTEYEKLYSISDLNKCQQNILEGFSLLRETKLDIDKYQMFLAQDAEDIENDELYELYEKGWLEKDGDKFSIHPVFSEFISESKQISIYGHKQLCNRINSLCSNVDDSAMLSKQDYLAELISFGKYVSVIDNMEEVIYNIAYVAKHFAEYSNVIVLSQRICGDNKELFTKIQLLLCDVYLRGSNFQKTKECLDNVLIIWNDKIVNEELYIEYILNHSLYLDKSSQSNSNKEYAIKELELIMDMEMDEVTRGRIYNCLGGIYTNLNTNKDNLVKALEYHEKAKDIREKNKENKGDLARTYNNIGNVYYYMMKFGDKTNNLQEAEAYYMKSLALRKEIFNSNHPDIARVLVNLGNVYMNKGQYKEAIHNMELGLQIRKKTLGENSWEVCLTYSNMVTAYAILQDNKNAHIAKTKAEEICLLLYNSDSERYKDMLERHQSIFRQYQI